MKGKTLMAIATFLALSLVLPLAYATQFKWEKEQSGDCVRWVFYDSNHNEVAATKWGPADGAPANTDCSCYNPAPCPGQMIRAKPFCEDASDRRFHLYAPVAPGWAMLLARDGNLDDCDGDGLPADFDGHAETALGGAWLHAADTPGCTDGAWADHTPFPTVHVEDDALALFDSDAAFRVSSDTVNNVPPLDPNEPDCGDFESDYGVDCVEVCQIGFPPGLDGGYHVLVAGTSGRVWTT